MLFAESFMLVSTLFFLTLFSRMMFGFIWLKDIVYQFYSTAVEVILSSY